MSTSNPQAPKNWVLLDDGEFHVELKSNSALAVAPGFLHRRCYEGVTTPGGFECMGGFAQKHDGMWEASVDASYDSDTGTYARMLGRFPTRLDAIVALWGARHEAHCRHI